MTIHPKTATNSKHNDTKYRDTVHLINTINNSKIKINLRDGLTLESLEREDLLYIVNFIRRMERKEKAACII